MCTWAQWVQVKFTTLSTIVAIEGEDSILFVELNFSFQNFTNYSNIIVIHHGLHPRTISFSMMKMKIAIETHPQTL
jgi:hypothetical protein